jgi:hypothetical protein
VAGLPGRARPAGTVADVIAGKEKPEFTLENVTCFPSKVS